MTDETNVTDPPSHVTTNPTSLYIITNNKNTIHVLASEHVLSVNTKAEAPQGDTCGCGAPPSLLGSDTRGCEQHLPYWGATPAAVSDTFLIRTFRDTEGQKQHVLAQEGDTGDTGRHLRHSP